MIEKKQASADRPVATTDRERRAHCGNLTQVAGHLPESRNDQPAGFTKSVVRPALCETGTYSRGYLMRQRHRVHVGFAQPLVRPQSSAPELQPRLGKLSGHLALESFHNRLQRESLTQHHFIDVRDADGSTEQYRSENFNDQPDSSIRNVPPPHFQAAVATTASVLASG